MTGQRSYGDGCGVARALDAVGERWALLIVRELLLGPKRFTDLRAALGASPNVLAQRLSELEQIGVVTKRSAGGASYDLTDWGRELHPVLLALGRWGARSPQPPAGELSVDALMLALEATFVAEKAAGLWTSYELRLDGERFWVMLEDGNIAIARGVPRDPDATIETDPATLRAVVFGDQKLSDAPLEMSGDLRAARRLLRMFARP